MYLPALRFVAFSLFIIFIVHSNIDVIDIEHRSKEVLQWFDSCVALHLCLHPLPFLRSAFDLQPLAPPFLDPILAALLKTDRASKLSR